MKVVKCYGTPREMGQQVGESLRDEIREHIEGFHPPADAAWPNRLPVIVKRHEECVPHLMEEMCGVAEGANLPVEEIYNLNFTRYAHTLDMEGCTNIAFTGGQDGPVWGKNNEGLPGHKARPACVIISRPNDGIPMAMFTFCGTVAVSDGMNAEGLAVGHSSVGSVFQQRDDFMEVRLWTCHAMRQARTTADFIRLMTERPLRGKGFSYVAVDRQGALCSLEAPCPLVQVRAPEDPRFVTCVNAYMLPALKDADRRLPKWKANALDRHAMLHEELSQGEHGLARMQTILRKHGPPVSICRHGEEDGGVTEYSMIGLPAQGRVLFCHGRPCRNAYEEVCM